LAGEKGESIITIESMPGLKSGLCNGSHMHSEAGKEDNAQPSTSEAASLQFNSLATGDRFCQFKFHFLSVITGTVMWKWINLPVYA